MDNELRVILQEIFLGICSPTLVCPNGADCIECAEKRILKLGYKKVEEVELPRILVDPTLTHVECVRHAKQTILDLCNGKILREVK